MPTNTYVALDKVTLTSNASDVTFSSIPSGYTDLVVVVMGASTTAGSSTNGLRWQLNGDTGANYSETQIYGNGSTATSTRGSGATDIGAGLLMQTSAGYFATNIISFMNYSNTTTYKTMLTRTGGASVSTSANVALWRSTSAITSIKFYRLTDQLKSGSTFSLYGIAAASVGAKATGGAIYSDSQYYYHVFGSTGTFTPLQSLTCDYLVVAGGGAGGPARGGGGGAGGLRSTVGTTGGGGSLETALSLSASAYTITVGAGGAQNSGAVVSGTNSSIAGSGITTVTATGGGGGMNVNLGGPGAAASGGSGGGGAQYPTSVRLGGAGTANQGFAGGDGQTSYYGGAGGGGAAAAGASAPTSANNGGNGGAGVAITGWSTATGTGVASYYAGGGGGGYFSAAAGSGTAGTVGGTGGLGGGGNGSISASAGFAGIANTGGGGGSGVGNPGGVGDTLGGNGGSGLVIVRYAK